MNRIQFLTDQLDATRRYTLAVLNQLPQELWPIMPAGARTHASWQVGHLVMAQYAHFVRMIGTETAVDQSQVDFDRYARLCGKGTSASADASAYPSHEELLADLEITQTLAAQKLREIDDPTFDLPTPHPHYVAKTRWEMGLWWSRHECLHTGQIALLRRMHGLEPWR